MGPRDQIERAMDRLDDDLAAERISYDEYRAEMRELQADLRGAAEDAAEQAYHDTMGDW